MPCKDITDILEINIDNNDIIKSYSITKRTCGRELLTKPSINSLIVNRSIEEILDFNIGEILIQEKPKTVRKEYLIVKHLVAVQSGLAVMLGKSSGSVEDFCTVVKIEQTEDGTIFECELSGTGLKEEIKSCGYYREPLGRT
ncbi:hypothetical protein ACFLQG_00220 [Candidatus Zixiibacteriota bacterium]